MFSQIREDVASIKEALFSTKFVVRNWIGQDEVCDLLKVTPRTLLTYREKGIIPYSQIGGKYFYRLSDIENHLDRHAIRKEKKS